jgi:hypothetical protein
MHQIDRIHVRTLLFLWPKHPQLAIFCFFFLNVVQQYMQSLESSVAQCASRIDAVDNFLTDERDEVEAQRAQERATSSIFASIASAISSFKASRSFQSATVSTLPVNNFFLFFFFFPSETRAACGPRCMEQGRDS